MISQADSAFLLRFFILIPLLVFLSSCKRMSEHIVALYEKQLQVLLISLMELQYIHVMSPGL